MPLARIRPFVVVLLLFVAGCAIFSDDPRVRSPGVAIDDQVIETTVKRRIWNSDHGFDTSHLVAVSYDGILLLAGQVGSEKLKHQAEEIARDIKGVRTVHNELQVGGPLSMVARANDSWITTKVKSKLLASHDAPGRKIKVVTEDGVVYLMGMLPQEQADVAVEAARSVYGVQKIVKVFEYL